MLLCIRDWKIITVIPHVQLVKVSIRFFCWYLRFLFSKTVKATLAFSLFSFSTVSLATFDWPSFAKWLLWCLGVMLCFLGIQRVERKLMVLISTSVLCQSCNSIFLESSISPNFIVHSYVLHMYVLIRRQKSLCVVVHRCYKVVLPWERYVLLFLFFSPF